MERIEDLNNRNSEIEDEFDSCIDNKICVYETVISGGYIKQEPCDAEYESGNTDNYSTVKDDKVFVCETVNSEGYIKQERWDTKDQPDNVHNCVNIKDEIIEDPTVLVLETALTANIKGNYLTCCEGCGKEYDLYCLKCPMLLRIFNSNNRDLDDNRVMGTLPRNFVHMRETQSGVGIVALRVIPKGVVFGPFEGLDLSKDDAVLKWISGNEELVHTKEPKWLHWMQYIRKTDQSFYPNLTPFQYEDGLYYRSDHHISIGDELLVCWDSDCKESATQGSSKPQICDSLDDTYACTLCCVGYKSISHLAAHNSRCPEKRNRNDFSREIIQCDICKIYMNKKEYSDYHVDQCFKRNTKILAMRRDRHLPYHENVKPNKCTHSLYKSKANRQLRQRIPIDNDDKLFACSLCSFKTRTNWQLKLHIAIHYDDKPFVCTQCSFKTKTKPQLKEHIVIHNDDKLFGCTLCPFKTKTNRQLKQHTVTHSNDKPFVCTLCSFKTKTKQKLKEHIVIHNDDKLFGCTQCPFKTKTNGQLKRHTVTHSNDKRFVCTQCSFKTKTRQQLKDHIVIHNDDKLFACTQCPFKTKTNRQLKRHTVTHSDDKPFTCTQCSFKTKTKQQLKEHIVMHNDDKPFECTQCPFKTKTNKKLKRHVVIHNDDKPFGCSFCSFKKRTKWELNRHIVTHNKDNVPHTLP